MIYTIKKGNHYSWHLPSFSWKTIYRFDIKSLDDLSYVAQNPENQKDINKIYGFSDSWNHHIHSLRIGWWYDDYKAESHLAIYAHQDGKRIIKPLGIISGKNTIQIDIEIYKDTYVVKRLDTGMVQLIERKSKWWGPRYTLFPFFGGQEVAQKDYKFEITKK